VCKKHARHGFLLVGQRHNLKKQAKKNTCRRKFGALRAIKISQISSFGGFVVFTFCVLSLLNVIFYN